MGPFLRAAVRTAAVCATAAAVHEIHHDLKKANKRAKKAEKEAREAQKRSEHISSSSTSPKATVTVRTVPAQPQPQPAAILAPVKPIMFHVNILSNRLPFTQPGCPNLTALSIFYDQSMGGWRAGPRGTRPMCCDNRGMPHTFVVLPHYVAFALTDISGQTFMLFSERSCSVCGEHALLTAQQMPYQQIVAMSHPQVMNEAGFPPPTATPTPTTTPIPMGDMQPQPAMLPTQPMPGQPMPPTMLPPQQQYPPGMAPPDSRCDSNPIYDQSPSNGMVPPPM